MTLRIRWVTCSSLIIICIFGYLGYRVEGTRASGEEVQVVSLFGTHPVAYPAHTFGPLPDYHEGVAIYAGDGKVTTQDVSNISAIVQTVSADVFSHNLLNIPLNNAKVVLYRAEPGYARAATRAFGSLGSRVVQQTGGFTEGDTVYLPLYKYNDNAVLANTLTHELTHAMLNKAGIGRSLPTWVNEGFAWYNGVQAETTLDKQAVQSMSSSLLEQVIAAYRNGTFTPLSSDPTSVLPANPTYNVEYQDYLAVKWLIQTYGIRTFNSFVLDVPKDGVHGAFSAHYPMNLDQFITTMNTLP